MRQRARRDYIATEACGFVRDKLNANCVHHTEPNTTFTSTTAVTDVSATALADAISDGKLSGFATMMPACVGDPILDAHAPELD